MVLIDLDGIDMTDLVAESIYAIRATIYRSDTAMPVEFCSTESFDTPVKFHHQIAFKFNHNRRNFLK